MWCLEDLVKITDTQLKSIFAYSNSSAINTYAKPALDRVLKSFNHSNNKYCQDIANEGAEYENITQDNIQFICGTYLTRHIRQMIYNVPMCCIV